jgi:uncharacterized phage protein (TIGR01671 family)
MDRLKFRGVWDCDGSLVKHEFNLGEDNFVGSTAGSCWTLLIEDAKSIEQCTWLKDKNGKLIYEGDVVNFYHENKKIGSQPYIVVYRDCNFALTLAGDDSANFWLGSKHLRCLEIVGNIHEHPELLSE